MTPDPIVDEIHRIRETHAAKFNFDLRAMFLDLQERQNSSGRKYVSFEARRDDTSVRRGRYLIHKSQRRNADVPADVLEAEIEDAIQEVRATQQQNTAAKS